MESLNIVFREIEKVEVIKENVGPFKSDEVLCAADKSLISIGTELFSLKGVFDPGSDWEEEVTYPYYPGYSMSARIIEVGNDVKGLKIRDRVLCAIPHKQYFIAKPNRLHLIPEQIDSEEATWGSLALVTQVGIRAAQIELGETVGVIGLGMLGQLIVQYLNILGVRNIFGFDLIEKRAQMAKNHGVTYACLGDIKSVVDEIKKVTNNKMLDVVFEMTGNASVLSTSIQFLRKFGRLMLIGDSPTPSKQCLGTGVIGNGIKIIGAHGSHTPEKATPFNQWTKEAQTDLFFNYLIKKRMCVKDLITDRYSPIDAPEVYRNILKDRSGEMGIIFNWELL